jgi:hypothetical protein
MCLPRIIEGVGENQMDHTIAVVFWVGGSLAVTITALVLNFRWFNSLERRRTSKSDPERFD